MIAAIQKLRSNLHRNMEATPLQENALTPPSVIILGAGGSGLSLAILLARDHGMKIDVYDALETLQQDDLQSYPIGINPRGMATLKAVDPTLEKAIDVATGMVDAWMIMAPPMKRIARMASGTVLGTTRGAVVAELAKVAQKTANIDIHLGHKLVRADIDTQTITFAVGGIEQTVPYSAARVVDASGCWSKLRTAVAAADTSFQVETWPWDIHFRNLFSEDPPPEGSLLKGKEHYIFTTAGIYCAVLTGRRWSFSLSVNRALQPGCDFLLSDQATPENIAVRPAPSTIPFAPFPRLTGAHCTLPLSQRLKQHVAEHCPPATGMLSEEEYTRFFSRRAFTGQVVHVSRLHHAEKICFIGDAAHSLIPSTGEGMNSALEDVRELTSALTASAMQTAISGDAPGWFETYNARRIDDVQAISRYAAWLLEGMKSDAAERNRRTASMVLGAIGQKMGLLGASWNDKTFGPQAALMEPYSRAFASWRSDMKRVTPWGERIIYWFAKDGGRKQLKEQRALAKAKGGGGMSEGKGAAAVNYE